MSERFRESDLRDRFDGAERYIRGLGRAIPAHGDSPDLALLASLRADIEAATDAAIVGLREQGVPWAAIAAGLGVTRQAVQQRALAAGWVPPQRAARLKGGGS